MSTHSHLQELRKKHDMLSKKVEEAQKSPGISDIEIIEMKKQKLRLKEAIERVALTTA